MIVTNPESNYEVRREYEEDEPDSTFYVEKASNLLYEVKFFPEFVLIRLAMPDFQSPVTRIDLPTFAELFSEYYGDKKELRGILFGSRHYPIIVIKKDDSDGD